MNPAVSLAPATLPADTLGVAYNQTITASGGSGTLTLAVSNIQNAIPGLTVPASGTKPGHWRHAHGCRNRDVHPHRHRYSGHGKLHQLQHYGQSGASLTPATLPADTAGVAYDQTIAASGGTGTLALAVSDIQGAIPGLNVPASGTGSLVVGGTPTAAGTETFTLTATDSLGTTTTTNYSITVNACAEPRAGDAAGRHVRRGLQPDAHRQRRHRHGRAGHKQHPGRNPGLTVPTSGTGSLVIGGTPTAAGTETFSLTATDSLGATTTTNYSITINAGLSLTPATLQADTIGIAYDQAIPPAAAPAHSGRPRATSRAPSPA